MDVTNLQAYFQAGQPIRFSLSNLLSSTYNVPIWASATLSFYYRWEDSSNGDGDAPSQPDASAAAGDVVAAAAEVVPDEVLPLVLPSAGADSTVSMAGTGDRWGIHCLMLGLRGYFFGLIG